MNQYLKYTYVCEFLNMIFVRKKLYKYFYLKRLNKLIILKDNLII